MFVKVRGFTDDAKKECLHFLHECFYLLNCQKVFILANLTVFVPEITFLGSFTKFRKLLLSSSSLSVGRRSTQVHKRS